MTEAQILEVAVKAVSKWKLPVASLFGNTSHHGPPVCVSNTFFPAVKRPIACKSHIFRKVLPHTIESGLESSEDIAISAVPMVVRKMLSKHIREPGRGPYGRSTALEASVCRQGKGAPACHIWLGMGRKFQCLRSHSLRTGSEPVWPSLTHV